MNFEPASDTKLPEAHMRHQCVLAVRDFAKAIPYAAGARETSVNHGFTALKGVARPAEQVAEARGDAGLTYAITRLNEATTAYFTVGCEKAMNEHEGKYWKRGYLEFAFNSVEGAGDGLNYMVLFFHLSRALHAEQPPLTVGYEWELEGAQFSKFDFLGLSACVWINTGLHNSAAEAESMWERGARFLADFLCGRHFPRGTPIY